MSPHRLDPVRQRALGDPRLRAVVARADAIAVVRRQVRDLAGGALAPDRLAGALLATSELVSNRLVHVPEGDVTVWAGIDGRRLRVEVHDGGPGLGDADRVMPDAGAQGGRGLALVAVLADRWGHRSAPWAGVGVEMAVAPGSR